MAFNEYILKDIVNESFNYLKMPIGGKSLGQFMLMIEYSLLEC